MTSRHLLIVGLLAVVAAALVGLNWTSVSGTADGETKQGQVEAKSETPVEKVDETGSPFRDELQKRCEKFVAKRVSDEVDEADIEDVCACAADEIHGEFVDELPDMIKTAGADPEFEERIGVIIEECVQQSGLE